MNALFTLKSAKQVSLALAILTSITPLVYPGMVKAASLQTPGQTQPQVFEIKVTDQNLLLPQTSQNQNIQPLTTDAIAESDPLYIAVHQFLVDNNSPLADYTTQLLQKPNWKELLSISFVESNMGIHNYYYNSSGIGGQQYLRKYHNFGEWIDDMSNLLSTRYDGWTFDQMDGIYVQPRSLNWKLGAEQTYTKLVALQQQADSQKQVAIANAQATSGTLVTFAINEN